MKKKVISLIVLSGLLVGCNSDSKYDKNQIAKLYVDILIAQEFYKQNKDSLKIITDSLHNYYQLSSGQYKIEIEKFEHDEVTWDEFFKFAEEYLDTLKAKEDSLIAEKVRMDSVSNKIKDFDSD